MITNWLSWKPGIGHLVDLGRDGILGIGEASILSYTLVNSLSIKCVSVLAQARRPQEQDSIVTSWLSSEDLALTGNTTEEWDGYRRALQAS